VKIYYSEQHRKHNPPFELFDGGKRVPYYENPDRMDRILAELRKTDWAQIVEPEEYGLDPILAVHDSHYIAFLESAWTEWLASDGEVAASPEQHAFLPATFALNRSAHIPSSLHGKGGYYMLDLSVCIVAATYSSALASASCALSAAETTFASGAASFALCRPPGHHAGRDYAAGYCFINNAAVAANWLSARGRVALLDIDYHAGNGSEDIFYQRDDVLTISIHGDPDFEYPHYFGYADETGAGSGLGFHKNMPLARGTDEQGYLSALDEALGLITSFAPRYLVVSAGVDTFEGDPLGTFKVTKNGFAEIGTRIAALDLPSVLIMEGGYANADLGTNVVTLVEKFK